MENNQEINSSNKNPKTKQKWKTSAAALRENGKTKVRRASKDKSELVDIKEEISNKCEVTANSDAKSIDNNRRSTSKWSHLQDKTIQAIINLMQITLDDNDTTETDPTNEAINSQTDEKTQDAVDLSDDDDDDELLTSIKEAEERNMNLAEKLAHYNELNVYGSVDLSSLNVTDDDIPFIFQRVFRKGKKPYTTLVLRDNALTATGVKLLVDQLLKIPTNLRNIGLSSNPGIGDEGIEHLIRLLKENRSITILALHHTGITDRGVRLLADFLCDNNNNINSLPSLEKLYISFNKAITDESLEALIQILVQNHTLKVLSLQHCSLSDRARRRLRQLGAKKRKRKFSLAE